MNPFSKIKENLFSIFQTALIVLLVVLVIVFVGVLSFEYVEKHTSELLDLPRKNETLKFLGIGMGGILIALQALMSYKRAKAMEQTAEAQADAAKAQADAVSKTEQGQRQDRLKNAIEHLGHESDSVRLGGAYELFHLAEDTEDLSQTVLDILCAHIRRTTGESEYREKHKSKPSEEIQSLLTLLFVQEHEVFEDCHINLQESWLNGANLLRARMQKANLSRARMQRANLSRARMQEADLSDARMQKANLSRARMQRANLSRARMQEADLPDARMQRANLSEAQMQEAYLFRAQMQDAFLPVAQMQGARLSGAQMQEADLSVAQMQGANLSEAQMQGAYLSEAQMQGANLSEARMQGAYLSEAQMQEAYFSKAQIQGIQSQEQDYFLSFSQRMEISIGKESDLSGVILAGGLSQEDVDSLVKDLSDAQARELRERLTPHIGQPESNQLPENSGAITGSYTKEEAEKWIAKYEKSMSKVRSPKGR